MSQAALQTTPPGEPIESPGSLYETHFDFVWRNLRRLGVPTSHLEDAAQDVFLVVHRRWSSFDPTRAAIETWLFGIVMRVAHTQRRSLLRRLARFVPWREQPDAPSSEDGPAELLAHRQAAAVFERVVQTIPADRRAVFLLVDVEQLSVPEVAQALSINLNTAYWRLREARQEFREALARATKDRPEDWR